MEELLNILVILLLSSLAALFTASYILMCNSISVIEDKVTQIVNFINSKTLVVADEKEVQKGDK